jgi:hypothetical protein
VSSIGALREAIADALDAIPDVQASAYIISGTPPYLQVFPGPDPAIDYDKAMQGRTMGAATQTRTNHDDVQMTIQAIVARTSDIGSQKLLDRLMENTAPYSVKAAVELDGTLGGLCDDCSVVSCSGVQTLVTTSGEERLVVEWTVQIMAPGD